MAVVAVLVGIGQIVFACIFGRDYGDGAPLMSCYDPKHSNHDSNMAVPGGALNQPQQLVRNLLAATRSHTTSAVVDITIYVDRDLL